MVQLPENPTSLWLLVERRGGAVEVKYSLDGEQYTMMRLAYLTEADTVQVGPMCASPEREGFQVVFEDLQVTAL